MLRKYMMLMATLVLALTMALPAGAESENGKSVLVRVDTTLGPFVLELLPDKAPKTVRNFLRYALSGFYDGTIFHRVNPDFMIQGGGFDASLIKKESGRDPIENEAANGLKNKEYTISMARTNHPHSATNEFFINVKNNKMLDFTAPNANGYGYCVFGQVVAGKGVVDKIKRVKTKAKGRMPFEAVPLIPVVIEAVSLVER